MRVALTALAAGIVAGYAAIRGYDAWRDLRAPEPSLPKDAAVYGRLRRSLMLAGIGRGLAASAALTWGAAPAIARVTRTGRAWLDPVTFFAGATLGSAVLDLPADYVESFVLERRFQMSDQTARAWLVERAKATAVSLVVAAPLVGLAAAAARRFPQAWPLAVTAALPPLLILANVVGPVFIAPLFNRFEPLSGTLEPRLRALAAPYGAGNAALLTVDMSRQTRKANAYVVGVFGTQRMVVGDTLLHGFSDDAVAFVMAHELGHYVKRDAWRLVVLATAAGALVVNGAAALARATLPAGTDPGSAVALTRVAFFTSILSTLAGPVLSAASRRIEWAADDFAVSATGEPAWGVEAFERLRESNLAEDEAPGWYEALFASHPSLGARIAALRARATLTKT